MQDSAGRSPRPRPSRLDSLPYDRDNRPINAVSRASVLWFVRLLILTVVTLTACREGGSPTAPADPRMPQAVTISGVVTDFVTNMPVAGVPVRVGPVNSVTDESGRFSLTLPAGRYEAMAAEQIVGDVLVSSSRGDVNFFINGGACRSRYGSITDARTGLPVVGATITLGPTVRSGVDGTYRLDLGCDMNHGSGTSYMRIAHPDYKDASVAYRYEYLSPPQRHDLQLVPR